MKYRIVTMGEDGRMSADDVRDIHKWATSRGLKSTGVRAQNRGRIPLREQLVGQPVFDKLLGPMWGGTEDGEPVIRYEDQRAYDRLSA